MSLASRLGRFAIGVSTLATLACATADDRPANQPEREPAIAEGHGRVCIVGPITDLALMVPSSDAEIERIPVTGPRTCSDVLPGLVLAITRPRDAAEPIPLEGWVDVGQTTTIELANPPSYAASTPETQALTTIIGAGRCLHPRPGCSEDERADELAGLQIARNADSVRVRQAARMILWKLLSSSIDRAEQAELADEIWAELERAPLVAASFAVPLVGIADTLGTDARRKLEQMVSERSGVAQAWSIRSRASVLLILMETAGIGASGDALRARVRARVQAEAELDDGPFGSALRDEFGFDRGTIEQAEILTRGVVEALAPAPCKPDDRWLLYVHATSCPACKPAAKHLSALLDENPEHLRAITLAADDAPSPVGDRPNNEAIRLGPALEAWFNHARGGVVTPYFFGLRCDDSAKLRLVGFGGYEDAFADIP